MAVNEKKRIYKKPEMKKESKMTFPTVIINAKGKKVVCRQCSSCHGCK